MKITATIRNQENYSQIIVPEFPLIDVPISGNTFFVDSQEYLTCCTLYSDRDLYFHRYDFEQIIQGYNRNDNSLDEKPQFVLSGTIEFETEEREPFFKDAIYKNSELEKPVDIPFDRLCDFDCVKVKGEYIFRVIDIFLKEKRTIIVPNRVISVEEFRENANRFCKSRR